MRNSQRPIDPSTQARRLEERHSDLKRRIAELDRRHFLTIRERLEIKALKKRKLAAKDALYALERSPRA